MSKSCVVLLSGGLDSLLALRLMVEQGLQVTALHSVNCFHGTQEIEAKKEKLARTASDLGARDIVFPNITPEVVGLTKNPRHGYGKNLNACIDCRLRTVAAGFAHMRSIAADFVVTGEVVGQRPMSQRRDAIALANREIAAWGHPGRLLRPLSARLLEKTVPETEGWVDERCLFDISGRGRDRQMALAQELGITEYPSPAGGCLLTDPGFSGRLAVLMAFKPGWDEADVELLKVGRHFQITPGSRIVASRNEDENLRLRELARPNDRMYINEERHGAVIMLRGQKPPAAEAMAAGLAVYYSKMREDGKAKVASWRIEGDEDLDREEDEYSTVHPDIAREAELKLAGADCLKRMRNRKREPHVAR